MTKDISLVFCGTMCARQHSARPLLAILIVATSLACRRDEGPAQWDVDVLAPVVRTSLTIGDLVADSLLVSDGEGAITLLYSSELFAVDLDTLLKAPDTTYFYPGAITFPGPVDFPPGAGIVSEDNVTRFDFEDVALRYLELRGGQVELEIRNKIASAVQGRITLPGATFPGGSNQIALQVAQGTPTNPSTSREVRDLSGVKFDLRGPQFNSANTLQTIVAVNLDANGSGATLTDQDSVNAKVTYRDLKPAYAKGYFGSRTIRVDPTTTELDLFRNLVSGSLDVDDVSLRVRLENGIGADLQLMLENLQAINTRTGNVVDLSHTIFQAPVNLSRATDLGNGFVPTFYSNTIDTQNSNVDEFLENIPDQLSYALELRLNPLGNITNGNDFVYADSRVAATLELEVPLRIIAQDLVLQTIVDVDLPAGFRSGELRFFVTNGFPFQAGLSAAIVDANGQVWSELEVSGSIPTGVLGGNGRVASPSDGRLSARVTPEQVAALREGRELRLRVKFNTADQTQHLRIYDDYRLDVQVVVGANYMVNGN